MAVAIVPPARQQQQITIVWLAQARRFFQELARRERDIVSKNITRLETDGPLRMTLQQFKSLSGSGKGTDGLWEIKGWQARLIGEFRPGNRFVIAHGLIKKSSVTTRFGLDACLIARRRLTQYDATEPSREFVSRATPKQPKQFVPTIVPPPAARPDPTPEIVSAPRLFREVSSSDPEAFVWAYVQQRDLLPPDCPLMQSLVRLPTYHNALLRDELAPYVADRLKGLPMDARMALGLLDESQTSVLMLGALWGIELLHMRALAQQQPAAPAPGPVAVPDQTPDDARDVHADVKLYWIVVPGVNRWGPTAGTRWLFDIVGRPARKFAAHTEPMVKARRWIRASKRWAAPVVMAARLFKDQASHRDPIVSEALANRG